MDASSALMTWSYDLSLAEDALLSALDTMLAEQRRGMSRMEKRVADMEAQRGRLVADLQARTAKVIELDGILETRDSTTRGGDDSNDRRNARVGSLQQRLEQLVAVHRQLLRKYSSLELENADAKKKLSLREERIRQLETNARVLASNMRMQAEKHVQELSSLSDLVQVMDNEHDDE